MTLINGLLAMGGFAFTIPLAIHFFYRSRFRTVDWGAMHLIEGMLRTNQRRIQWLNLLLLLVRCSIPILLAFCLARPLLTGFRALPGDAPQSVVIAIDDSRSMGFATSTGQVRMDKARESIKSILDSLTRRDEIIFLRSSAPSLAIKQVGAAAAERSVRDTSAHSGPVDLADFVRSAITASRQASQPNPRVIIVSDFQKNMINEATLTSLQRIADSISKEDIRLEFLNIASENPTNQQANVSVESITMDSTAAVVGRRAIFHATIRNHGDDVIEDANVVWSINGKREPPKTITIPGRSFASVKVAKTFDAPEQLTVTATVELSDSLTADNQRSLAVDVIKQVNVWLVDDFNEGGLLQVALSPFASSDSGLTDPIKTTRISTSEFVDRLTDSHPDVVVFVRLTAPPKKQRETIGDYVNRGGSVILFDHPDVDPTLMNSDWGNASQTFLLPAEIGESVGKNSLDSKLLSLEARNDNYSPWSIFGDVSRDLFSDVRVSRYRRLRPRSSDQSSTLISLESGDPLVVMTTQGLQRVVQFAISADGKGSTLPLRPAFVPMMQQMVLDLARSRQQINFLVGENLFLETSKLLPPNQENTEEASFYVQTPGQNERPLTPKRSENQTVIAISNTSKPGVYRFRSAIKPKSFSMETIRVLEVPTSESIARGADPAQIELAANAVGATSYGKSESLIQNDQVGRYGREIWRWLLSALLLAMVVELWISQRLGDQSNRGQVKSA